MRTWHSLALALVLTAPLALATALPAMAAQYTVVVENMKFGPLPATLHVGDVIVWQNKDVVAHTATARDKSFDVALPANGQGTLTLTVAGTIPFFCKFHPGMTGQLVVSP
jgi:plastocyanin